MGQERIAAIENVGDSVELVGPQADLRVDAAENDMTPIVFPEAAGIEKLVVFLYQRPAAFRVAPYPVLKSVLDGLLCLLGQGGFLLVQDTALLAVRFLYGVINANIPEV